MQKPLVFPKGPSFSRRGQVNLVPSVSIRGGSRQLLAISLQPNRERGRRAAIAQAGRISVAARRGANAGREKTRVPRAPAHALSCGAHPFPPRPRRATTMPRSASRVAEFELPRIKLPVDLLTRRAATEETPRTPRIAGCGRLYSTRWPISTTIFGHGADWVVSCWGRKR